MTTNTDPALATRLRDASPSDTALRFRVLDHGDGGTFADAEEGEHEDPTLEPSGQSAYEVLEHRQWAPALARLASEAARAGLRTEDAGAATDEFLLDLTTGDLTRV
jgi:hypothetical protein